MKKVFYLGPADSYSHSITKQVIMGKNYALIPVKSFSEIIADTLKTKNAIGVLPVENSITSNIHENVEYIFNTDLKIFYEAFLRINLHLFGLKDAKLSDITTVYSHERALAQCTDFIHKQHVLSQETPSTSAGKEIVVEKRDKTLGVIGSKDLQDHPQLKLLKENVGNNQYNMTRFIFVAREYNEIIGGEPNKATIIFKVPHIPGSLANLLTIFAQLHLNLTKIESRPIPGTTWEYQFWIDIENTNGKLNVEQITEVFKKNTLFFKITGVYSSGKIFES